MIQTYEDRVRFGHINKDGTTVAIPNDKADERKKYPNLDIITKMSPGNIHLHGYFSEITVSDIKTTEITEAILIDGTGKARVIWYETGIDEQLNTDDCFEVRGELKFTGVYYQIINPKFRKLDLGCRSFDI